MSLAEELLDHSRSLAKLGPHGASQADLRRAVSAAYYSVFHLLSGDVGSLVIPLEPPGMRERIQRSLTHRQMKTAADAFSKAYKRARKRGAGKVNPDGRRGKGNSEMDSDLRLLNLLPDPISVHLSTIAEGFVELYQARMDADYDVTKMFNATDVRALVKTAETIFETWSIEKPSRNAPVFLASLMFGQFWTSNWTGKQLSQ